MALTIRLVSAVAVLLLLARQIEAFAGRGVCSTGLRFASSSSALFAGKEPSLSVKSILKKAAFLPVNAALDSVRVVKDASYAAVDTIASGS